MPLTAKHRELLSRAEKRTKELNDFLAAKGDNITAADLTQAHAIRDDLKSIKTEIEVCVQADEARASAQDMTDFLNKPGTGHTHQAVVGAQAAGDTTLDMGPEWARSKGYKRALSVVRQRGAGLFGKRAFDAASSPDYRRAFCSYVRFGEKSKQFRTLEEGLDPQGGYLAPLEVIAKLIQRKATPTRVQDMVDVVNTSRDACLLPLVNYTGATDDANATIYSTGFRATATDENPTSDTQAQVSDTNIFGSIRVPVYTWLIEGVLTNNQVEDGMFDPLNWMVEKFVETIMLLRDNMALNGSGVGQSTGILSYPSGNVNAPTQIHSGTSAAPWLTPDGIISITEDIPEQYDDNCYALYKKTTTGKTIRQFKDAQGRYLFGLGYQDSGIVPGRQKALNGYPVVWSQFMPDPASNALPLIFGDFKGYTMVNRVGFTVQVLREIAARRNQVILLGRVRFGGQILEPWRLRTQLCSS